jgi:pyridoxamine 5'-phosphate oxidase
VLVASTAYSDRVMSVGDNRREYSLAGLDRGDLAAEPLTQFTRWFDEALARRSGSRLRRIGIALYDLWHALLGHASVDVNAMILATADGRGVPSARTVLLKGVDERGFTFYTNYDSRKGRELGENPHAALVFYWPTLERQVCVAGEVTRLPEAESARYFATRPRGARLAAWASSQSAPIDSRAVLESAWQGVADRFHDEIPLPPNWGGFVLAPQRIEFWQGRPNRLHDRFSYAREANGRWCIERLAP